MPKYNMSVGQSSSDREILPSGMVLESLAKPQSLCSPVRPGVLSANSPQELPHSSELRSLRYSRLLVTSTWAGRSQAAADPWTLRQLYVVHSVNITVSLLPVALEVKAILGA